MNRKILLIIVFGLLASIAVVPMVKADESLYISNSELNTYYWWDLESSVNTTMGGKCFEGNDEFLSKVVWYIKNDSTVESGTIRAVVFNNTVAVGSYYKPVTSSVPVAYSTNTYDVSNLAGATLVTFNFSSTYNLTSGTIYGVALETATPMGSDIKVASSISGGMFYGTAARVYSTHSYGAIIYVYTDNIEGGGEPYTPPETADTSSWDTIITSFTGFMVPLVVTLTPAFLLVFLTGRVDKWLLLIGLAIGAGLGFYFGMVPLWLVFLITIGLIGMAYQSVRSGGNS